MDGLNDFQTELKVEYSVDLFIHIHPFRVLRDSLVVVTFIAHRFSRHQKGYVLPFNISNMIGVLTGSTMFLVMAALAALLVAVIAIRIAIKLAIRVGILAAVVLGAYYTAGYLGYVG